MLKTVASLFRSCGNWSAPAHGCSANERIRAAWRGTPSGSRRTSERSLIQSDGSLVRTPRLARLEAALLISEGAVPANKLVQTARLIDTREVQQLVDLLNQHYDASRSAFRIEQTATGFQLMTRASLSSWLDRLHQRPAQLKLSAPMQETLTIIAYQQPVTRADVEAIRGVQSSEMIRQLLDRELIRIAGTEETLGRPFLYETTRQFLSLFALQRIEDLPGYETLRRVRAVVSGESMERRAEAA